MYIYVEHLYLDRYLYAIHTQYSFINVPGIFILEYVEARI